MDTKSNPPPDDRNRTQLRATFDDVALGYDRARPGYPEQMFDDIVAWSGIAAGGRVLEIGCGTGQATLPLARRGFRVHCVELGANLAAVARQKLAAYPDVMIDVGAFETYPIEAGAFDLALSATAFHWIDPAIGYPRLAHALRPGGTVALCWNAHVQAGDGSDFFDAVQRVYERETPEIVGDDYHPLRHPDDEPANETDAIDRSGLFGPAEVRRYHWTVRYDAAAYLAVLDTYSGHRSLPAAKRQRLYDGIAALIDAYGGTITKGYLTLLYLARVERPAS
jgi:SAM-dependent methyltransferase